MFEEYREHDIAVFAGYITDSRELLECSSGGLATAMARKMIQSGGYVAGVRYTEDFYSAKYVIIHDEKELSLLKGSKYIDAEKGTLYQDIKKLVENGEKVLFFGLPCMIAAMKKFLKKDYDNLITCALICHGPMSPKIHREYIAYLEKKYGSRICEWSVRYKKGKWMPLYLHAGFENGETFEDKFYDTEYGYAFRVAGRESCYHCKFKGNNREGDIMIGDFWGVTEEDDFWNEKGVSSIFVHTEKGLGYLKSMDTVRLFETSFERAVEKNPMVIQSREEKPEREKFTRLLEKKGLIGAVHVCTRKKKIKKAVKKVIPKSLRKFLKKLRIF